MRKSALLVLAVIAVGVFSVSVVVYRHQATQQSYPTCTSSSINQLPHSTVQVVEDSQARYKIPSGTATTLLRQNVSPGLELIAFVNFLPEYCGYDGNINYQVTGSSVEMHVLFDRRDRVDILRDGKIYYPGENVCISNTLPTVRQEGGSVVMVLTCDRAYKLDTWMQKQPKLESVS